MRARVVAAGMPAALAARSTLSPFLRVKSIVHYTFTQALFFLNFQPLVRTLETESKQNKLAFVAKSGRQFKGTTAGVQIACAQCLI
jgi:hypothetical protein